MMQGGKFFVPAGATKVLIMVDNTKMYEPQGRWISPYCETQNVFLSFIDMIIQIDNFYTDCGMLQQSMQFRSFEQQSRAFLKELEINRFMTDDIFEQNSGGKATFIVQVLFRQNATWQGKVKWIESGEETKFRSTLELLKLMDTAITSKENDESDKQSI